MSQRLPYPKQVYRLWYQYLQIARQSSDKKVRKALERSARYYKPWGDIDNVKFDAWWKKYNHLFEEQFSIRRLSRSDRPDPKSLLIEVPLTQPKGKLFSQVRKIIADAYPISKPIKGKFRPVSQYRLTAGAEPRTLALNDMLIVYRDVYLKNKPLRGQELLDKVHAFYRGRKRNKQIPSLLQIDEKNEDNRRALRNMRRYISKAERVMLNVAKGNFPGDYE
jgi:hypothetical protein